jgi:DNA adenine methylase
VPNRRKSAAPAPNQCKSAAPFLKWVGGKRQLLPVLRRFYPEPFGRYFEPFVGSGAVFFDLLRRGALEGGVTLSDDNADLIGCYLRVGDSLGDVIAELDRLAAGHAAGGRQHYLGVRDERFNPARAAWRGAGGVVERYPSELAAMLIYLNRTGYNGLFRLNASGEFNVPPGRYDNPTIVDRPLLAVASRALSGPNMLIRKSPFDGVLQEARAGDFVYFDPPYSPLSATSNFRGYTGRAFSAVDQQRLQQVLIELARRKVHVLLSNSTAPDVVRLYDGNRDTVAAGLKTWRFPARRAVNSKADRRGVVQELVVSNLHPRREA